MLTLSMFININTSKKRSRIARNLESVHVHLTDLQALFSRKRNLERKNVILFFFDLFFHTTTRATLFGDTLYTYAFFLPLLYIYIPFFLFSSFLFHIYYFHCGNNFSSSCHTARVRDLLNK